MIIIRCRPRFESHSEIGALPYDNDKYICKVWVYKLSSVSALGISRLSGFGGFGLGPASKGMSAVSLSEMCWRMEEIR